MLSPTKNSYLELRGKEFALKKKRKCSVSMNDVSTEFLFPKGNQLFKSCLSIRYVGNDALVFLWKPFSPCPSGVVSIFLHLFHGCCWILAPCFYPALTQRTLGFTPLEDRINIKGATREHLREEREVEWGMTFPSKHMLCRWGREGLQPCWKEICVHF